MNKKEKRQLVKRKVFNKKPILLLVCAGICLTVYLLIDNHVVEKRVNKNTISHKYEKQQNSLSRQMIEWDKIKQESVEEQQQSENEIETIEELKEYQNMPEQIKGYPVVGKLIIPKINLETYIIEPTDNTSLNISVTKLEGPDINKVGNFCITGHNYKNDKMFGELRKLEIGDEITLIDTFDRPVLYKVYEIMKVKPDDISCVSQDTGGDREVTLITCTVGAINRIVVKCVEVYD